MGFAENLREELKFQDIQTKELAVRTGISKNTLDKYLSEKRVQPGVENAVKIARVLGVSVEYLTNGTDGIGFTLGREEKFFLRQFKRLNEFNRRTVTDLLSSLASRQSKQISF